MKKRYYGLAAVSLVVLAGLGIYVAVRPSAEAPVAPPSVVAVTAPAPLSQITPPSEPASASSSEDTLAPVAHDNATVPTSATNVKIAPRGPLRIRKGDPIPEIFPFQKEREEISRLATLSPAEGLNPLLVYLTHDDPLVREETRTALIRLGAPAAAPHLLQAAQKAPTPQEAQDLREAADFLALVGSS